ncbi:MAG: hypothetical protein KF684_00625 [Phycisphaeraceae bacterium]|nr:hypothetical protein [Phycisphaeraceae bacterium]
MRASTVVPGVLLATLGCASSALSQQAYVINDRTNDVIWRVVDLDASGVIDENEVFAYFTGANAPGTLPPQNPSTLTASSNGWVAMGDQINRLIYLLRDNNADGDADDLGESVVYADATNLSGASFAFPTGAAFGPGGHLYIVNAGNAFGPDAVYRLVDLDNNGDCNGPGEVTFYLGEGAFGPGNGPFSPQEIAFIGDVGYLRNSSAGLHGVWRFEDLDSNGVADDAGEFTVFFDATNQSGIVPAAGFPLEADLARPGSLYFLDIAPGAVDRLIRLTDLNADNDANDTGEAVIVYENAASGFTAIDVVSLADGRVLMTDAGGDIVIVLEDLNSDGDFMDAGEATVWFANSTPLLGDVRQMSPLGSTALPGDTNADGVVNFADLNNVLSNFGLLGLALPGNVNSDAQVNFADLNLILSNFGSSKP